ncbi:MAG: hypothetical protein M3Z10_01965 [Gemmatimonadota bacterium]|nr:hypothetical protein [Gemmatimonadota bacterium]
MYTTCLFCNGDLGRNEVVEAFPVGRRLAFDGAKGRLWVVCRRCERWNLTPLEERWEAIETCEREFRSTKLRVSTDEIGLARLKEGLELVRIGAPQRPEMAAWRYGDQFGRRRRRYYAMVAGGIAVAGTVAVAGPMLGLIGAGAFQPSWQLINAARNIYRARKVINVPGPDGELLKVRLADVDRVQLTAAGSEPWLHIPIARINHALPAWPTPWWRHERGDDRALYGAAAIRAAGALLPSLNRSGGSAEEVQRAVRLLEQADSPQQLYQRAAAVIPVVSKSRIRKQRHVDLLKNLPATDRLALEMAAHEETERRALEGELHILEAAWRDAEEIAGIADDMFLPASVDEELARLKRQRDEGTP